MNSPRHTILPIQTSPVHACQATPYRASPRLTVPVHACQALQDRARLCQSLPSLPYIAPPVKNTPRPIPPCLHRLAYHRADLPYLPCHALPSQSAPRQACHAFPGTALTNHAPTRQACHALPSTTSPNRAAPRPACHALHRIAIPSRSSQRLPCQSIPILTLPSPEEHCLPLVALHQRPNIQVRSMKCSDGRGKSDHRFASPASSIASHTLDSLFRWKCLAFTAFSSFSASSTATFIRSTSFATSSAMR